LIALEDVTYAVGGRTLFEGIDFTVTSGMRVGLVGPNGSGKTTLLRLLRGEIEPTRGEIRKADSLAHRLLRPESRARSRISLRRALAPDSDSVIYQDRVIHVASWAARFLFDPEH
jgi:ATP-binding cassette subfamily F protein uup